MFATVYKHSHTFRFDYLRLGWHRRYFRSIAHYHGRYKGVPGEWHLYAIACLPDERHITGPQCGTAIVDKDRVLAGHLDVHVVASVDEHDVGSGRAIGSLGDGRGGIRFQADP